MLNHNKLFNSKINFIGPSHSIFIKYIYTERILFSAIRHYIIHVLAFRQHPHKYFVNNRFKRMENDTKCFRQAHIECRLRIARTRIQSIRLIDSLLHLRKQNIFEFRISTVKKKKKKTFFLLLTL